ncbi:MAG TPA: hypothetical protein VMG12_10395, partial [Polyangiaceae bacterium]|nr:hypothetical protein [Polyangiaceae bacterium]
LPDFHRELVESGFIEPAEFELNVLQYPSKLSARVLPAPLKHEAAARIEAHIEWLRTRGERKRTAQFQPVLDFIRTRNESHQLPALRAYCQQLDQLRGEDTATVFPELASVLDSEAAAAE